MREKSIKMQGSDAMGKKMLGWVRGARGAREFTQERGEGKGKGKGRVPLRGDTFRRGGHLRSKQKERAARRTALVPNCR